MRSFTPPATTQAYAGVDLHARTMHVRVPLKASIGPSRLKIGGLKRAPVVDPGNRLVLAKVEGENGAGGHSGDRHRASSVGQW